MTKSEKRTEPFNLLYSLALLLLVAYAQAQDAPQSFRLAEREFLLDGEPFQIISGELHPARIPHEYWPHRIRMARAMGCNTVALYVFWNFHETREGKFDFSSAQKDISRFIKAVAAEQMWVLLRPGPYVCGEWDFGGLPPYLLKHPDIRVRCRDPRYMEAVHRYIEALSRELSPLQVTRGGPILMLQLENEYGSYGNDGEYLKDLASAWRKSGFDIPFFTADGPTPYMLEAGSLSGCAVGLDSGAQARDFALAQGMHPAVPVFSSETYPGWLTHWGEKWARPDPADLYGEIRFLLENRKSFNLYVIHGGTNFAFSAGANSGGRGYEPDVTSYDYDAPIDEQGRPTAKYHVLRKMIASSLPNGQTLPAVPAPLPVMEIAEVIPKEYSALLAGLDNWIEDVQPRPMEVYGQYQGLILYRTVLRGRKSGRLVVTNPRDYVLVYLDGRYIGKIDRRLAESSIEIPASNEDNPRLDLLVEAMGRINYGQEMIDPKGITQRVTLAGMTLMNWRIHSFPLDEVSLHLKRYGPPNSTMGPLFFRAEIKLEKTADSFIDMSRWQKGMVWVNGHNLGRYWNIGPQQRLFCPAPFLKKGINEILVLDLHQRIPAAICGRKTMEN